MVGIFVENKRNEKKKNWKELDNETYSKGKVKKKFKRK